MRRLICLADLADNFWNPGDQHGGNGGDDDLGNHEHAVIDDGIDKTQNAGGEGGNQLLPPSGEALLGKEPLGVARKKNVARQNMAKVAKGRGHQGAQHQLFSRGGQLATEDSAQAQGRIGQHIVQGAHNNRIEDENAASKVAGLEGGGHLVRTQGHLNQGVGKGGGEAPFDSVTVGQKHHGQHTDNGQLAAEGHGGNERFAQDFQYHAQGNEHGAFGETLYVG